MDQQGTAEVLDPVLPIGINQKIYKKACYS